MKKVFIMKTEMIILLFYQNQMKASCNLSPKSKKIKQYIFITKMWKALGKIQHEKELDIKVDQRKDRRFPKHFD